LQLWVRALGALTTQPLVGTEGGAFPFWSPDSRWIAYFARDRLVKMPASGGPGQTLCDTAQGVGDAWSRDGVIVFGTSGGSLQRVSAAGGRGTLFAQRFDLTKVELKGEPF
jgi:hypothetical protein